jgi:hypothetical protein
MMNSWVSTGVGVLLGGLITWLVSWLYYRTSARELRAEAAELRRLTTLMLRGMEHAGWVRLNRDAEGRITGGFIEILLSGSTTLSATVKGTLSEDQPRGS